LLFVLFFLLFSSCRNPILWGQTRDELYHSLEVRDYSFLDSVDGASYSRVLVLGSEAPYFFGLHLSIAGRTEQSRTMFALGTQECPEPYRTLCAEELAKTGSASERLAYVETLASTQKSYETLRGELLVDLGRYDEIPGGIELWYNTHSMTASLAAAFSALPSSLSRDFLDNTAVRANVFRKSYKEAWIAAKAILERALSRNGTAQNGPNLSSFGRLTLSDFGKAALYGSQNNALDAAFFDQLAKAADNSATKYILRFYAARLYGDKSVKAAERYENAMTIAPTDDDYDNALWYLLNTVSIANPDRFLSILRLYAKTWKNPESFDDLLDSLISSLVQTHDWSRLSALRDILPDNTNGQIRVRLNYLSARLSLLSESDAQAALTAAFEGDHGSLYYRVLSAEALNRRLGAPDSFLSTLRKPAVTSENRDAISVLRGLVLWGLPERIYPVMQTMYPEPDIDFAREMANTLTEKKLYGDAIKVMLLAIQSSAAPITDEDLAYIYPRPWLAEVSSASARFGVPAYFLYALIRTESYFQSGVLSSVGAVGLTQLMKPTAADIAKKLKIDAYDLGDPATNISFGAYYLSALTGRLDGSILNAFFAYNAGITRVREWQREWDKNSSADGLSGGVGDIFLEGLPYNETREYGRKVLAAAVVYGYLYYQKTTEQVVRELF